MALGLYTALPGFARWDEESRGLLAVMLPFVGILLGLCWTALALLAERFLPRLLGAALVACALPLLTGFLHLDGFMDCADALLSARDQAEKRRILKDPHTGAFAVIALAVWLLFMFAAADGLLQKDGRLGGLLVLPVISRGMAALAIMTLAPLEGSYYGRMYHDTATGAKRAVCVAVLLAAAGMGLWMHAQVGFSMLAAGIVFMLACGGAARSLGGMNGDVSGWSICMAEMAGMIFLACL